MSISWIEEEKTTKKITKFGNGNAKKAWKSKRKTSHMSGHDQTMNERILTWQEALATGDRLKPVFSGPPSSDIDD